jgi:hypothetical protein
LSLHQKLHLAVVAWMGENLNFYLCCSFPRSFSAAGEEWNQWEESNHVFDCFSFPPRFYFKFPPKEILFPDESFVGNIHPNFLLR